ISEVTQESLRRHIAMVTQDTSLLHRSIRDNIRYGRPDASEAEIVEAAKRAHAHEFILGLTDREGRTGYDAHAGERGVKLSGGQRQRIAIARVLLKNAPILVLDEATSALDSEVEAAIQEQLYALMENTTVIAIAHRLSTIAALERLIVLDQGRIVESGTHDELLARNGLYAKLWRHQSGGFLACDVDESEPAEGAERERALGTGTNRSHGSGSLRGLPASPNSAVEGDGDPRRLDRCRRGNLARAARAEHQPSRDRIWRQRDGRGNARRVVARTHAPPRRRSG